MNSTLLSLLIFFIAALSASAGLTPLKLNTVVVKGLNDDGLPALARLTIENPWHVRFIELMPIANAQDWGEGFPPSHERYISVQEIHTRLSAFNLELASVPVGNGPARTSRIPGAAEVALFPPVSGG